MLTMIPRLRRAMRYPHDGEQVSRSRPDYGIVYPLLLRASTDVIKAGDVYMCFRVFTNLRRTLHYPYSGEQFSLLWSEDGTV